MKNITNIVKYSGEIEEFNLAKLINSLRHTKADESLVLKIAKEVQSNLKDGMTTKQIYEMAFKILKGKSTVSASKYKLKKAIMELGPSGFPFEKFIEKIFEQEGFKTEVGVIVQGNCVQHEIDVVALKNHKHYMIECKFHNDQGRFCNVKIPLYIQSRFIDVEMQWKKQPEHNTKFHKGWVYTNTRFTTDAIQYASCAGLGLVSWDYPKENGLKERIDKSGLQPLTSLTTLTKTKKTNLLDTGIVLCKELHETPALLNQIGIEAERQIKILEDLNELCAAH